MRRATPSPGLSPQLIKHFAIATVAITGLLAMFASGEDWGAQAQVQSLEAKQQLAAQEAAQLGTGKVKAKLKVRRNDGGSMPTGGDDGGGSGGGGGYSRQPVSGFAPVLGGALAHKPVLPKPQGRKPTADELEAMLQASRDRSGSNAGGD